MSTRHMHAWLAVLLLALAPAMQVAADAQLRTDNAWIREAPPGHNVLAGYITLHNSGGTALFIEGVSGENFSSVEIHRTVIENGVARMLPVDLIEVPAGGKFSLEPGGHHFMLFNPERPLKTGDSTELLLHVRNGPCLPVSMSVQRMQAD